MYSDSIALVGQTLFECSRELESVTDRGQIFVRGGQEDASRSYAETMRSAAQIQFGLVQRGFRKADRVVLAISDPAKFIVAFFGAIRAGIIPVPTAPPTNDDGAAHLPRLRRVVEATGARAIIVSSKAEAQSRGLGALAEELPDLSLEGVDELDRPDGCLPVDGSLLPSDVCFLQFTSGSTGDPKVVVVRHAHLAANVRLMASRNAIAPRDGDRSVSWLPFWHDMGLIGLMIVPVFYGAPAVFIPTEKFIRSPNVWMSTVSKYRGTVTYGPNFAFDLVTRRASEQVLRNLDLSCLRVLGCGAEPINPGILRRFMSKYALAGLKPESVTPSYGMAEATLAITFDPPTAPPSIIQIDRSLYESQNHVALRAALSADSNALEIVSCGQTGDDHQVAILDKDTRTQLAEDQVGEIVFRGPSVTGEYYENPHATHATFRDGWLNTGDLGFIHKGRLFVCGRSKDLLIVRGRNYYPQDLEWVAAGIRGVRSGSSVAFSVQAGASEDVYLVAEVTRQHANKQVADAIARAIHAQVGLVVRAVLLVAPGTVPRTTSGKPQRGQTRRLFIEGKLQPWSTEGAAQPETGAEATNH